MAINLKAPETEALLRRLAELTGDSLTQAAHKAFESRLRALESSTERSSNALEKALLEIASQAQQLPVLDARSEKELSDWAWGEP